MDKYVFLEKICFVFFNGLFLPESKICFLIFFSMIFRFFWCFFKCFFEFVYDF